MPPDKQKRPFYAQKTYPILGNFDALRIVPFSEMDEHKFHTSVGFIKRAKGSGLVWCGPNGPRGLRGL
jgi:hypothetical protein